jgi:hypothetical protein
LREALISFKDPVRQPFGPRPGLIAETWVRKKPGDIVIADRYRLLKMVAIRNKFGERSAVGISVLECGMARFGSVVGRSGGYCGLTPGTAAIR